MPRRNTGCRGDFVERHSGRLACGAKPLTGSHRRLFLSRIDFVHRYSPTAGRFFAAELVGFGSGPVNG
jgi:hypothetical protein